MRLLARAEIDGAVATGEIIDGKFLPHTGTVFAIGQPAGEPIPVGELRLLAPTAPRKVLIQMGGFLPPDTTSMPPDAEPWLLPKVTSSVSGQDGTVLLPKGKTSGWAEVEVAIIIGATARSISEDDASRAI